MNVGYTFTNSYVRNYTYLNCSKWRASILFEARVVSNLFICFADLPPIQHTPKLSQPRLLPPNTVPRSEPCMLLDRDAEQWKENFARVQRVGQGFSGLRGVLVFGVDAIRGVVPLISLARGSASVQETTLQRRDAAPGRWVGG